MARPKASELTDRELAVMKVYWQEEESLTADEARRRLSKEGEKLAYTTVANVVRILVEKKCLKPTNDERPFRYKAIRSFEAVSKRLVGDLVSRLFSGSREALLVQLFSRRKLTAKEREFLKALLEEERKQ